MTNKEELKLAIYRSEKAYELYAKEKLFFQALRIYKANEIVYKLLQEYQLSCSKEELDNICLFIYHLEDWMLQFETSKQEIKFLNDTFVFERWNGAIPYPKEFINESIK